MTERPPEPRTAVLILPADLDHFDLSMVVSKGHLDVSVELDHGRRVPVTFYEPTRLAQDIQSELEAGYPVIAWQRLMVIERVTPGAMQAAIDAAPIDFFQ